MRQIVTLLGFCVTVLVCLLVPCNVKADTPLPPPKIKEVWSHNKEYCAVMDPQQMITTVYRVEPGDKRTKSWSMYGWFRVADLSNDGNHLITGHPGINLLPLNFTMDDVMIYFFRRGELIHTVQLKELVSNQSALKRTASHFLWGSYLGLDSHDRYLVETVENRKLVFDIKTGKPLAETAK
ncbi:MAG TPA: hypothetical protein VIH42_12025 [Thermoguttaceae bacterium]